MRLRHGKKPRQNLPPGSLGLPFLGEALAYARSPHAFIESRARKYGSVFKTRILGSNLVCFVGPEPFSFFVDNPAFERSGGAPRHVRELLCHDSLPLIDGPRHAAMRGKVSQAFAPDAVSSYLSITGRLLERYADRWRLLGEFAWVDEYKRFSASACAALLLGAPPEPENNDRLWEVLDEFMAGLAAFPLNLPWTTYGRAIRRRNELLSMIDSAIAEHRRSNHDDMLARLLDARDSSGEHLAENELRAQVLHLFFAAYGGLMRVLSLMCMNLAQYTEIRARAVADVDAVAADGPLTMDVLLRLHYVDAVTREVRRHNRIFASSFFDRVARDETYGPYEIPAGWKVTGAIYQTMQDESVFAEPSKFEPERFEEDRNEAASHPNSYIPHGGGSISGHRCPAEDLSTLVMVQAAALLLRSYEWELAPSQDLWLDDQPSPLPRDGVRVRFRARSKPS